MHILAGDNFTIGMGYKDNFLAAHNKMAGHEVVLVSSLLKWKDNGLVYANPCDKVMQDGVRLVRLPFKQVIHPKLSEKLRILLGIDTLLDSFRPDVIRALNLHNLTIPHLVSYKKKHPEVKIYLDSHQDYGNSNPSGLAKWLFHKLLVKPMIHKSLPYIDKVFYCQDSVMQFLQREYKIPRQYLEFFPMGGVVMGELEQSIHRANLNKALSFADDDVVLLHSGKMNTLKHTIQLLKAFQAVTPKRLRLLLVGSFYEDIREEAEEIITSNDNITYMGWKSAQDLRELMAAADVYVQPGSASTTIWQSICCGNILVASQHIKGYDFLIRDNGWFATETKELMVVLRELDAMPKANIVRMRLSSLAFARERLDYHVLARRLTV